MGCCCLRHISVTLQSIAIAEVLEVLGVDHDQCEMQPSETWEFWILFMISTVVINVTDWFCSRGLSVETLEEQKSWRYLMFQPGFPDYICI